ncbi:hypothetical protein M405DRAFT_309455 [Rhizopogon salebrosus TDB-379]|nr:hypothetical protein M405DRAFT_309455 [Rhizopogon salebrosus TDB-379]
MSCYCYKSVLRAYLTASHCHISIYHDAQEDPRPMILHTLKSHAILAQQNCRHCHISIYHDAQEDPRPMILHTLKSHAILAQQNCRRRSLIAWFYFNRKQPHARVVMPMVSKLHSTTT